MSNAIDTPTVADTLRHDWDFALPGKVDLPNGRVVAPVQNPAELDEISRRMNHCVSELAQSCEQNESRVYQIQPVGESPVELGVTVQLGWDSSHWRPFQARDVNNRPATPEEAEAALQLGAAYNAAWKETNQPDHDQR